MYTVELYARVRRAVLVEGRSQRVVAREFRLARKTVSEDAGVLGSGALSAPEARSAEARFIWQRVIDAILEDDNQRPEPASARSATPPV